jgi:hypothetical protein
MKREHILFKLAVKLGYPLVPSRRGEGVGSEEEEEEEEDSYSEHLALAGKSGLREHILHEENTF